LEVHLTPAEIERLEAICNPSLIAGTRYDAAQMRALDSEKE
jgi:hypothetical protein